ncbi:MAG: glycosyltransferase family 2 protein [Sphingomonadales bacterium]
MRMLSVMTPCFNEEENVEELYRRVREQFEKMGRYRYEHIFIDNASTDRTVAILKGIAASDPNVKIIVNARNFGHIRSPMHALLQASGDAVISMAADLQDPPEMIPQLVEKWEAGFHMVLCIKRSSEETAAMFWLRKSYYALVERLSSIPTIQNFTGFGLYSRQVVEQVRRYGDPNPYFRGMIAEIGLSRCEIPFDQPTRKRGITKNNFYTLYDLAMLGITNLSKVPLRLVTGLGFLTAAGSIVVGLAYFLYKLAFWNDFELGLAPLVIGMFFLGAVQLIALGIIGEYVGAMYTTVQNRPYVTELERINFGAEAAAEPAPELSRQA